ncbi:MAG: effector-associated domain EAD1-containing protein, partial [Planctomycetaceae bacterium]
MRLSGSELRQVHDVVVQAFSLPDLEQVFQFQFDTPLAVAVRVSQPLGSVVFDLLNWAQQRDVLKKLLLALGDERPQSESLGKVLRELGVTRESELPTQTPSSPLPGQPAGGPRPGVG